MHREAINRATQDILAAKKIIGQAEGRKLAVLPQATPAELPPL